MTEDKKTRIAAAFAQLAARRPIDKITVKELVAQCGISRQTFYYHFQDLLEVMEWLVQQIIQQALTNSLAADSPRKAMEEFIQVSQQHRDLLLRLLSSQRRAQVERIFVQAMRESIRQMIFRQKPDLAVDHQDLEVALSFYAYATAGVVFENSRRSGIATEQLAEKLCRLLSGKMIPLAEMLPTED